MSPISTQVKAKDVVQVARKLGFEFDRQKGSQAAFYRSLDKVRFVFSIHIGRYIKTKYSMALSPCEAHAFGMFILNNQ